MEPVVDDDSIKLSPYDSSGAFIDCACIYCTSLRTKAKNNLRKFDTGAIRDNDTNKLDYSGFLSPQVLERFATYMDKHRNLPDGSRRGSNNWKNGIPIDSYKESLIRHTVDWWKAYEDGRWEDAEELACALIFNIQGFLHEQLKKEKS